MHIAASGRRVWLVDLDLLASPQHAALSADPGRYGPLGEASAAVLADYVVVQMVASVATGQATPEEAAQEAERRAKRYYRS